MPTSLEVGRKVSKEVVMARIHTLDSRAILHTARNSDCQRKAWLLANGFKPSKVAEAVYGLKNHGMSAFQRTIGVTFERLLLEDAGAKLFAALAKVNFVNDADRFERPDLFFDLEVEHGKLDDVDDQIEQLEFFAEATRNMLIKKLRGQSQTVIIAHAVLKIVYAGYRAFIKPDFLVCPIGLKRFSPGEAKSILMLREDTASSDVDKMNRQTAVEMLAIDRVYSSIAMEFPELEGVIVKGKNTIAPVIIRSTPMTPTPFLVDLKADLDFLKKAEKVIEKTKNRVITLFPLRSDKQLDEASVNAVPPALCDDCEAECDLSSVCREGAAKALTLSSAGDDLGRIFKDLSAAQFVSLVTSGETFSLDSTEVSKLKEKLVSELSAAETEGGLQTLEMIRAEKIAIISGVNHD